MVNQGKLEGFLVALLAVFRAHTLAHSKEAHTIIAPKNIPMTGDDSWHVVAGFSPGPLVECIPYVWTPALGAYCRF